MQGGMTNRFGFWAAMAACAAAVGYGIPQLLQVAGLLADPWDRILIFAPSLLLAPAFVCTMAAVHEAAPAAVRPATLSAFGLAVMYATLVGSVYVTQLGTVIPADLAGRGAGAAAFACCGQGRFMTGIDLLGYTLMSLSTLLASPAVKGWARLWMVGNGLLAPVLIGQLVWPQLILLGALWLVTFPVAMLGLAAGFGRRAPGEAQS